MSQGKLLVQGRVVFTNCSEVGNTADSPVFLSAFSRYRPVFYYIYRYILVPASLFSIFVVPTLFIVGIV